MIQYEIYIYIYNIYTQSGRDRCAFEDVLPVAHQNPELWLYLYIDVKNNLHIFALSLVKRVNNFELILGNIHCMPVNYTSHN